MRNDASTPVTINIPAGLDFADLKLAHSSTGGLLFSWDAIRRVCEASHFLTAFQVNPAELVLWLIQQWYYEHREAGRPADPVFEMVLAQMDAAVATQH